MSLRLLFQQYYHKFCECIEILMLDDEVNVRSPPKLQGQSRGAYAFEINFSSILP